MALKLGRTQLKALAAFLATAEAFKSSFEDAVSAIKETYDDRPERWQESDAATEAQERIDTYETVVSSLEELIDNIGNVEGVSDL